MLDILEDKDYVNSFEKDVSVMWAGLKFGAIIAYGTAPRTRILYCESSNVVRLALLFLFCLVRVMRHVTLRVQPP